MRLKGFQKLAFAVVIEGHAGVVHERQLRRANQVLRNFYSHAEKATDVDLVTFLLTPERQT